MELNTIQTEGTWNEVAEALNDNFSKIGVAIKSGTGSGGGGTVSEELEKKVDENTSNIRDNRTRINQVQNQVTFLDSSESTTGSVRNLIQTALQGTYSKPSGGIPASDLETSVQASLQRADSSIQGNDIYSKTELDAKFDAKIDKNGGEIKGSLTHIMSSTGGDASGYEYKNASGERIAGFGAYANKGELIHTYIGFGKEPWGTYNGLNVGENIFTYKGKAIWYSGQEITESVKISTGSDNKIILNNTDGDTKYSFILFMDKGEEYGRLGTNGTSELRWNNNIIIDSKNYTTYVLTKDEVQALLDEKQPYIDNLTTIIANADKGATALQPGDVYTKEEMGEAIGQEVSNQMRNYYTRKEAQEVFAYRTELDSKQAQLRSGDNIATINGQSLLDGGNINIGNNGVTDVLKVSLDVSSFAVGKSFSITDAQLNAILQSRSGYTVVVKDGNNTSEWGQVIGCYFLNIGGGVTFYRITIMHHTNDPQSTSGDMVMYNIDVMIQPGYSNHECKVISIKTL